MTAREMRDELARIAEKAPEVRVPDDTYLRGRRSTARRRAVVGAAVVACLALVGGLSLGGVFTADGPPVATDGGGPAVPDHLYAVPDHVSGDRASDLAVGRGAAAFLSQDGTPVLVDAAEGGYHLLDLPDLDEVLRWTDPDRGPPLALSPDGRYLAWGWSAAEPDDTGRAPGGIRIADLLDGTTDEVPLSVGKGVHVNDLAWSADSESLVWTGRRVSHWQQDGFSSNALVGGRVGPDRLGSAAHVLPEPEIGSGDTATSGDVGFAATISTAGEPAVVSGSAVWRFGRVTRFAMRDSEKVVGAWFRGRVLHALIRQRDDTTRTVTLRANGVAAETSDAGPGDVVRVLGPLGPDSILVLRSPPDAATSTVAAITATGDGQAPTGATLVTIDGGLRSVTLATDLIDLDARHPTVTRPAPDWPWSSQRKAVVFGGSMLVVVCLVGVGWWWRRRRT